MKMGNSYLKIVNTWSITWRGAIFLLFGCVVAGRSMFV